MIRPAHGPAFVAALPVKRFQGVGSVTAARMSALGIVAGADPRDFSLDALSRHFGSSASYFHHAAHGDDDTRRLLIAHQSQWALSGRSTAP